MFCWKNACGSFSLTLRILIEKINEERGKERAIPTIFMATVRRKEPDTDDHEQKECAEKEGKNMVSLLSEEEIIYGTILGFH